MRDVTATAAYVLGILTDDLGLGDISCYPADSGIQTPNIDRLDSEGEPMLQAYPQASVRSPTRHGLLTGRFPRPIWHLKSPLSNLIGWDRLGRITVDQLYELEKDPYDRECLFAARQAVVQRLRAKLAQLVPEQRIRPLSWVAATKPRLALAWWVALPHIPGGTFPSGGLMSRSMKLRTLLPACLDMMRWLSHTGQAMDARIVRNPIYQQLNDRLRSALAAEYRRGDRFLTEREIAERFGVSRPTANKALASLVSEGLLEFRRGIGTFVQRDVIDYDVRSLVSFTEKAKAAGKRPTTELITYGKMEAIACEARIRRALAVGDQDELWELDRLRLVDATPVILEHRYIVLRHCPRLTKTQVEGSLYRAWTEVHQLAVAGADEIIRAVLPTRSEAQWLQVPPKTPVLEVTATGFLEDQSPLWWERTLYRADQYEFHSRLGPIQSATPARGQLRL
jgi:GntR family transcriptional regulator